MSHISLYVWLYIAVALVAANLPWLSERKFFVFPSRKPKSGAFRLLEWLVMYLIVGGIGMGLERRLTGEVYPQNWVFYTVTLALFLVFALPGFIYRYDLRKHLKSRQRAQSKPRSRAG